MNPTKKPAPRKRYPTPTRHGNWQMVNGQLMDVQPGAASSKPAADAPKADAADEPAPRRGR